MTEKQCPFCCETIASHLQKCPYCGEDLDVSCPYCGNSVSSKAKICSHCSRELMPRRANEPAPLAIASFVLMFFFCTICICVCMSIFDTSPTGIPNSTIYEKLKNIRDLFFFFLLPLICSIIACFKKQGIGMAIISVMISVLFCLGTTLVILGADL